MKDSRTNNIRFLILISLISAMGGFLFGYETVVIAGTISFVKNQFSLSSFMEGWLVSSGLVGCVMGVLIAGHLSDRFGRKAILILSSLVLTVASIGCGLAPDTTSLILFRIVGGMGVGLASIVSPLYISEVAPPNLRGRFVSLFQLSITLGIVVAMLANAGLLSLSKNFSFGMAKSNWYQLIIAEVWRAMFLLQGIPAVLFFIFSLLVPDSPRWLASRSKSGKALEVLLRLRFDENAAKKELEKIQQVVSNEKDSVFQLLKPGLRKALFLGIFLAVFSELSGITIVMYYGPTILEDAGFSISHSLSGHAAIGIVLALSTLLAVWLVDKYGRRRLLLTGVSGAFISLLLIGIFFSTGITSGYFLVVVLCLFVGFFAFSIGPIKWIIISEIFPTKIRARAMGIATLSLWLTDVIINQFFPIFRDKFGIAAMFFIFSGLLLIHFYIVWKKLPETKGMSLEEIESLWKDTITKTQEEFTWILKTK
jgi:MFS transporter, SP family, arabinose:H+ symporter